MKQKEIIRMAQEAGGLVYGPVSHVGPVIDVMFTPETLERFACLVAAAEREACAKVCEDFEHKNWEYMQGSLLCAAAIRARGAE